MNSHTRIRIFTIIAFILIAGVLYFGYTRMQQNTQSLLKTVDENARPAEDLLRIKELWISFNRTSTDIRSFAVTRDDNYLSGFMEMKDTLIAGIDSLKAKAVTSGRPIDDLLELESALDKKVSIYDSLLEINYNRVMISAIEKMKPDELEVDTASVIINEGNFFQRSFTRKYSRKALQAKVDSMILARAERITTFKQNLSEIRLEEERLIAEQAQKELALLAEDKKVTGEIERLIKKLESDEHTRIKEKAVESVKTAGEAAIAIRQILIAGLVVIFILVILVLRDLEVAGKRRKELVEARLKAEKLARAKEEFMATMSHEIRTPLTSVIGFAAKLGETTLDPVQQRFMKAIAGSSEHLLSIVNDVLDFTRVDSGKLKFETIPFKVADIFIDVYDALVWKAEEKNIKLNLYIKPVETLLLHGDPVRLRQVLFNLVGNAIKFTHKGSVDITATFLNENGSAILLFKISDTGIGIPSDKLEAIFGEFEQAESNTEKKYGGSGLGLAITKRVVEQQGGNVSVESSSGLGSVFSVRIPFTFGELETRETSFTEDVPEYPLKGLNILLAEDDPMIRELQTHSLEGLGAKVVVAEDGLQALELFKVNPVDIIIMDIQMPEMTGPEAVKIIRTTFPASRKNVPVIAMTANVLQHDLKRWMDEGMSDFVTKPFKEQDLVDKINDLLHRSAVRSKPVESVIKEEAYSFAMEKPPVLYDLAELKATSQGNIGFVSKMINLFLTSSFASVNNLKFHLKQKNWEQLGKTSHRMIGSYKQMGMPYIAAMLKELESVASEQKELGKAAWLVQQIEQNSTEVFRLLKSELEQLS